MRNAEEERIAPEKGVEERLAGVEEALRNAEEERIASEKAEEERLAKEEALRNAKGGTNSF